MISTKRLRVLHLGSPTGLYGAERWILALVKHLPKTQVESIVAVVRDAPMLEAALCSEAAAAGFRTHVFEAFGKANFSAVKKLKTFVDKEGIHILHTHGYKMDIIGRFATLGSSCRIISTPHGWSTNAGTKLRIYELLDRLVFPFLDAVVPLSIDLYASLKKIPLLSRKLQLIQNGVDISEVDSVTTLAHEMRTWKDQGDLTVGYIGQLISRKNIDTLLRAFRQLSLPNKRLVIVGEGDQRVGLERLATELGIRDRVNFMGFREERLAFLKGFDVFVLPSKLEGIPRCLMEAMAAGVPVIASNIPGCRDLIIDGKTGLLFEVQHADSLAQRLEKVLCNVEMRGALTTDARRLIVEKYSAHRMAKQYSALYFRLLGTAELT